MEIIVLFAGIVAIGPLVRGSVGVEVPQEPLGRDEPQTAH
jgi:hypothetical protein